MSECCWYEDTEDLKRPPNKQVYAILLAPHRTPTQKIIRESLHIPKFDIALWIAGILTVTLNWGLKWEILSILRVWKGWWRAVNSVHGEEKEEYGTNSVGETEAAIFVQQLNVRWVAR